MPNYRHVVRLPYETGLPSDVAVNVFHSISDDDVEATGFNAALVTFYAGVDQWLSNILSTTANACSITAYDLSDPPPRAPVATTNFTLVTNATEIPPEVAICMSFQGIRISGQRQARRRGRVFIGPLGGVVDSSTGRPQGAVLTSIRDAGDALLAASGGVGVGQWAVYSVADAQTVPVNNGWVDNEFDTIRERSIRPNTRFTFS